MNSTNYKSVGVNFGLASLFYLVVFFVFLYRKSNEEGNKNIYQENNNDNQGLNEDVDNDKTESFIEGRL